MTNGPLSQPHQQRVLDERDALAGNVQRLGSFIGPADGPGHPTFMALPDAERRLLERQHELMTDYLAVLDQRIALWN